MIHQEIIDNILLYLLKELFDAMEKKPIKKVPIEEIPKGPGVCEVCDKHVDNLNLHMCDEHKVTN